MNPENEEPEKKDPDINSAKEGPEEKDPEITSEKEENIENLKEVFNDELKGEIIENITKTGKAKIFVSVLKLLLLIGILVAVPAYIFICHRDMLQKFDKFEDVMQFLQSYKTEGVLVYIGLQIVQIVVCIIPGQAFQFAAGYLYGFFPGLIMSIIGAMTGTLISFYLSRFLGRDAMHIFFSEEKFEKIVKVLNSKRAYTIVFIIYLIPGLPKDITSYAAGISTMKFRQFLVISTAGRIPGMSGSLLIGALYLSGHYTAMMIIAGIAVAGFLVCIIKRKRIWEMIDKAYDKLTEL